jgi:predicted ferric reductase
MSSRRQHVKTGPAVLLAVALGNVALWLIARPDGEPTRRFIGELCAAEAVLLFSCSLVLVSLLPFLERAFGGLDRLTVWHRRTAVAGVVLLVPHVALVTSPPDPFETTFGHGLGDLALVGIFVLVLWAVAPRLRAARRPGPIQRLARTSHERWLTAHRLTGGFVAVAMAHALIVDPVMRQSPLLKTVFLVTGGLGLLAYVYRELIAPKVLPVYDYTVASVTRLNSTTAEVRLRPLRGRLQFEPGQFVVLAFGGADGWQWHPFSVSGASGDDELVATVKASGDYTGAIVEKLQPGVPARVVGPFGDFDYRDGGYDQVWIAGGIGVTPFISWIRSLNGSLDRDVDFYYSVRQRDDAVYLDEIEEAARRYPTLRPHLVLSDSDGLLTADEVISAVRPTVTPSIYMCGPPAMAKALSRGFRQFGVEPGDIRWEQFDDR